MQANGHPVWNPLSVSWRKSRGLEETRAESGDDGVLAAVAEALATDSAGVEFVYESLDRVRECVGADDLIAVVEDPAIGRQAFRAGRRPIDSAWSRSVVMDAAPGLHARPGVIDATVGTAVLRLFAVALRLDAALHDSRHDHLTGLWNRRAFDDLLGDSCARSARYGWPFGLILIDLDDFKSVNDRLGHPRGDAVLEAIGNELRQHLRVGDAAARLGGDEFAVLFPNLRERRAVELVDRLEAAVVRAVPEAGVTVSTGVALAPTDGVTPTALYHRADQQLYECKRARR